ncbi:MAG TPA: glycosyltransferase [Pseudolabrys sp.]|nr:glycosyltransferase [Pseudolabrys sp.]
MQLSILLPTCRHSAAALARIAQACSWACPEIEVIIRDNSGNFEKRAMLAQFRRDHCKIVSVEPCSPRENYSEALNLATGEFIFCIADDDMCLDRAIAAIPGVIDQHGKDPSVVGINGSYAVETSHGTSIAAYDNLDSDDVMSRVMGLLTHKGPNVLFYSALRRSVVKQLCTLFDTLPFSFSFHDQILCLFYLLNGKFLRMPRLFYVYDLGVWETGESAQKRDADFYKAAGLDLAINKLQWLLCGFEGASLVMHAKVFPQMPIERRQTTADFWFTAMFDRFRVQQRMGFGSLRGSEADKLCHKLRNATGQMTFQNILSDICAFIALSSPGHAQKYFDYWATMISSREPALRKTGS